MRKLTQFRSLWLLLTAGVLFLAGCGGPTVYPVEGEVVYEESGKPLAGVMVVLEPKDPEAPRVNARGETDDKGHFNLTTYKTGDGALEGLHKALVNPPPPPEEADMRPSPSIIDPKFLRFETSGLEYTVTRDKNVLLIKVHKPRPDQ